MKFNETVDGFLAVNKATNSLLNAIKNDNNYGYTENGGIKHNTTNSALLDMFGQGGSMRKREEDDIIMMFKRAYLENPVYALKCLFYLRDCRGGAGERRFFRVCLKWLANYDKDAVLRNIEAVPEYGRYDDWLCLFDTPVENKVLELIEAQLTADMNACQSANAAISLLSKWLPSETASASLTKHNARKIINYLHISPRQYRKMLSVLRERIHVLEKLMSANQWELIDFSKIPSRAGLIYRESFKRHEKERYAEFINNKETKVNADVLNPVDIAHQIFNSHKVDVVDRQAWEKAWSCLPDYYNGKEEPGIAIVDVSGSMAGTPMEAAVSMGAYIAERGKGPFKNHFITFSGNPQLVKFEGVDLYDKFKRCITADWGGTTNIEAVFDLLLNTARKYNIRQNDMPKTLYIFSDQEFNGCISCGPATYDRFNYYLRNNTLTQSGINTVIETQMKKWQKYGYEVPRVIFWNLDARQSNIPALGDNFSYVSGFSMSMVETILSRKNGYELMMEKLNSERYKNIK